MRYLHVVAERGVGPKEDLALLIDAVVHAGQLGGKPHLVAAPGVRVQEAGAGFGPEVRGAQQRDSGCTLASDLPNYWHFLLTNY